MGMVTTLVASTLASLAGTAMSVAAQGQQAAAQRDAANYQAEVAKQNRELADEAASAARKEGYDAATRKRQDVAALIGRQRAVAAGSGAAVDTGSFLDLAMDTAEKGEADALALYQQGLDKGRNLNLQGWSYGQQAEGFAMQARNTDASLGMAATALGGVAQAGSNFGSAMWGPNAWTRNRGSNGQNPAGDPNKTGDPNKK